MLHNRVKVLKKSRRMLSIVLAGAITVTSIPAICLLSKTVRVEAAINYKPKKLGVCLLCNDMVSGSDAANIYNSLVRTDSQAENKSRGSYYNSVFITGLKFRDTHGDAGKAYWVNLKSSYKELYNLAKKGQVEQSVMANIKNHSHSSFTKHWKKITQYGKIILGYPNSSENNLFYVSQRYDTGDKGGDTYTVGDTDKWAKLNPDKGYDNRLAIYMTTKKGCEDCSGAKVGNVSLAFKDTTAPKMTSIKITDSLTSDTEKKYFKENDTVFVKVKFSENVRLADNSAGSVQSSGVKLALALGKANTSGVTNVYADLVSLEGDTAVFSYRVPGKITIGTGNNKKDEKMDFYVSGLADISVQDSLIVKKDATPKFKRVFVGPNSRTISDSGETMQKLKVGLGNNQSKYNAMKKTTSAITDIAGNPLDTEGFKIKNVAGLSVTKAVLDTVNPKTESIRLESEQKSVFGSIYEKDYLKSGSQLKIRMVVNEYLQEVAKNDITKIKATLNVKNEKKEYLTTNASSISRDSRTGKTTIFFNPVKIDKTHSINVNKEWSYNNKADYKITITKMENTYLLKDYSENQLDFTNDATDRKTDDFRDKTSNDYLLDNHAPSVMIDNVDVTESDTYEMARENVSGEVYSVLLSVTDKDNQSDSDKKPFASGVMGAKGTISVDLGEKANKLKFQYYLSNKKVSADNIKFKETAVSGDKLKMYDTNANFDLPSLTSNIYLYIKFIDSVDYGDATSGVKVTTSVSDINNNTNTVTAKFAYTPKDKVKPVVSFDSMQLKENNDNSAYEEVVVRIKDAGGIDTASLKYKWVEEGEAVPNVENYDTIDVNDVKTVTKSGDKVTECLATVRTKNVTANSVYKAGLYVWAQDVSYNGVISGKLTDVDINMELPAIEIGVPNPGYSSSSSLIANGPYTESTNEVFMFVAVKDPMTDNGYFIRTLSGKATDIAMNGEELFDSKKLAFSSTYDENEAAKWKYATIVNAGGNYTVTDAEMTNTELGRLLAIAGDKYYGKVHVMAGTGFKAAAFTINGNGFEFEKTKGKFTEKSFYMMPEYYGFSNKKDVEGLSFKQYYAAANKIDIVPKGDYGKHLSMGDISNYNPEDNGTEYLTTLAGASFEINISNKRTKDFITDDIDYDSDDTYIKLKNVDTNEYVYSWTVEPGQAKIQGITIPDVNELKLDNGHYALEVSLSSFSDENNKAIVNKEIYDNIYLKNYNDEMTEAFGVDKITTNAEFTAKDEYGDANRVPYYGFKSVGDYKFTRKIVDKNLVDYTSELKSAYEDNAIYLGKCGTQEIENKGEVKYNRTIKLSVNGMDREDLDRYWIKVWTGEDESAAKWYKFDKYDETNRVMSINVKPIDVKAEMWLDTPKAYYDGGFTTYEECTIPIFEGSNIVSYRIMNLGAVKSEVHEIEMNYCTKTPDFSISVGDQSAANHSVEAMVTEMNSDMMTREIKLYESDFAGAEGNIAPIDEREFSYSENGRHLYYIIDGYGNINYEDFYIHSVDNQAPSAEIQECVSSQAWEGDTFEQISQPRLKVKVMDDRSLLNADIQISVDDREPFKLKYDDSWSYDDETNSYYQAKNKKEEGFEYLHGVYNRQENGMYYLELDITLPQDTDLSKAHKEKIGHSVSVSVIDEIGNPMEGELYVDGKEFYGLNVIPKLINTNCEAEYQDIQLVFNSRVYVTKVNGNEIPRELYSKVGANAEFRLMPGEDMFRQFEGAEIENYLFKDYCGISKDGKYNIEFEDEYGNKYKDTFEVKDFFGDYSADIEYSTLEKTNGDVVATITGTSNNAELSLKNSEKDSDKYTITWNKNKSKATILFKENASVSFNLKVKGAVEDKTVEYKVTVGNIDKQAPEEVEVNWKFNESGEIFNNMPVLDMDRLLKNTTSDSIEVWISSETEDIVPVNGKELSHTFSYSEDMDRSYTFEYADECGNEGKPITVTLPDELVMTEYEEPEPDETIFEDNDTEAPAVSADVYAVYENMAEYCSSWNPKNEEFSEIVSHIGLTGGYKINYSLVDNNKSKIVVLKGINSSTDNITFDSTSEKIDGVIVSTVNNSVIVTKKCELTIVAVDSKGNKVAHSLEVSEIDDVAPTISVKKVGLSFTKMRLKFYGDDNADSKNAGGTIVPVTQGLTAGFDDEGFFYYKDVDANGAYNTTFKDKCGNRTSVSTKVTEIDNEAPKIDVVSWSPCYVNNGKAYEKLAPTLPTNRSVILKLDFSKTVSELKVYYKDNENWVEDKDGFSKTNIELGGRSATVEFTDKVPGIVKVVATSPNGKSNQIEDIDLVDIIDKKTPEITFTKKEENNTVKVTYKSDEMVLVNGADSDTTYGAGTDIPLTIKKNGTYKISFTDMAGNITEKTIKVNSIDETAPEVFAIGIPESFVTPKNCNIQVTMSEKGTITFQGKEYKVKAPVDSNGDGKYTGAECDWVTLPINANGSYQVKARDEAGLVSYKVLEVKYVDDSAPNIRFTDSVVKVSQGTSVEELEAILTDDSTYNLWDNIDKNPDVKIKNMPSENDLKNQGIYEVKYILTDSAGNKRQVDRYVKVISSANIRLTANGELMSACDTTIILGGNIDFSLEKSKRPGESFKVYYKQGIEKSGAMKKAKVTKDGKLRNLEKGFYTLYIVTRNKETYLTYLYIVK